MNDDYKRLRAQADKLFYKFKDTVDDQAAAGGLGKDVREIVELFEMDKGPRSIDDHIKDVQRQLRDYAHNASEAMDAGDLDDLIDGYEELREELHDLDNF